MCVVCMCVPMQWQTRVSLVKDSTRLQSREYQECCPYRRIVSHYDRLAVSELGAISIVAILHIQRTGIT